MTSTMTSTCPTTVSTEFAPTSPTLTGSTATPGVSQISPSDSSISGSWAPPHPPQGPAADAGFVPEDPSDLVDCHGHPVGGHCLRQASTPAGVRKAQCFTRVTLHVSCRIQ
ncbi:unnamed protein product [Prorocentrum cordatum]|uniref:Uncharacterized protein n=1 Tax=Prorocentrum cordatum TaxID=2364126 RepID=A0ABN9VWZ3_9DINO|nr:unnamed protein product [Polarella glacialis]